MAGGADLSAVNGAAEVGLTAGDAARRLGVAVTTLRSWHVRYGLGPESHVAGHHRRYGPEDLRRLELMRSLTASGMPAARAARMANGEIPIGAAGPAARAGGGSRTIGVGRAGPAARGLAYAAMRLDAVAARGILTHAVRTHGVLSTWDDLVRPVLAGIGNRYAATRSFVDVEHLLTRTVSEVFAAVPRPTESEPPRILLAAADEEQHTLPLEALAAALAERDVDCRLLGGRVPPAALYSAVRRTGSSAVVVWAQTPETARPELLRPLLAERPRPAVVAAAGPGWAGKAPPGAAVPTTLTAALDLIHPL